MDTTFKIVWISWIILGGVIEAIALFNSRRGDTLSEHLWAWLSVRKTAWWDSRMGWGSSMEDSREIVTPKWTLRVARTLFIFAMVWFTLHIATGGWV